MKKKIGFVQSPDEVNEKNRNNPSEELVTAYIDANYTPYGEVEQKEFRTTRELIVELDETVTIGMSRLNKILKEKGFNTIFIEGISNWVLYIKN